MTRRLLIVSLVLFSGGVASGELEQRVPGTIRIGGDPDRFGEYETVVAFPKLRFKRPLWLGAPPDGTDRIFVLEQDGRVRAFPNRRDVERAEVVLDISARVYRGHNEEGLLGMAFHPEFAKNRYVYLHYSMKGPRRGVVSRFRMDRSRSKIDPRSEKIILEQKQPWGNHNGGGLEFGPDGYLYITFGDGGAANDPRRSGQNLSNWLGTILRIDVDSRSPYAVPKDNPFVKTKGARPEIWAYGLRNVWRFSFDRRTGALWAGDVGQSSWEEIDVIERGGNYGWNMREGKHAFGKSRDGPFVEPVIDYDPIYARSITGGYVYRGKKHRDLDGVYLHADYATGNVWGLRWDGVEVTEHRRIGRRGSVASFGEDQDGEVYLCCFDGRIYTFAKHGRAATKIFPRRLSETGLFTDTKRLVPHSSLIPYSVNVPLWSDGAEKDRWVMLPGTQKIKVGSDGRYAFPDGTIFVKHFRLGGERLETRLLLHRRGEWAGYTYVWNEEQEDAFLIDARMDRPLRAGKGRDLSHWTFPGRSDCMSCHTAAAGRVLGFRAEQLDRDHDYGKKVENQLTALKRIGLFEGDPAPRHGRWPDWDDEEADPTRAVRTYLDANCAMCHQPDGPGNATIDLRSQTPLAEARLVRAPPGQGNLGVAGAKILTPGNPRKSTLWLRMQRTDDQGMPNLAHNSPDKKALARIAKWIRGMR